MPKTSPNALYNLEKGIFVPENKAEYEKQLLWNPKAEDDTPPPSKICFTRNETPQQSFSQRRTKKPQPRTNKRITRKQSKRLKEKKRKILRYTSSSDEFELWSSADENTDQWYDPGSTEELQPDSDGDDPANPPDSGGQRRTK